ncbi:hypothetical protein RQP53_02410 [Paucibacter sp. APW11]|uniref:Uncharacterized protein n=1 Tax=Roseateles aquae TaxID=3077235 RepID=A0ABU3P754_9BURK|nr:hypothetical protein [Paucibacter sp. APW11]MDT8998122.1 hypothetical protein [Paucibacter sp. APW11]
MKRISLLVCLAALLPALALAQTVNPKAKVDPKNNKVSRPVVEKPKQVLLTREQLRSCLTQHDANEQEAVAIKAAQAANQQERDDLKKTKEGLMADAEGFSTSTKEILAERDAIVKEQDALREKLKEMRKGDPEAEAAIEAVKAKAAALDARITAYNKSKNDYQARAAAFDARIEPFNKSSKDLENRTENHLDAVDTWKRECGNKAYDEADEIAVRKEMQQQGK